MSDQLGFVERGFAALPYGSLPIGRAAWAGLVFGGLAYTLKPGISFDINGHARPWILFNDDASADPTIFPAWAWVVVPGAIAGLFL